MLIAIPVAIVAVALFLLTGVVLRALRRLEECEKLIKQPGTKELTVLETEITDGGTRYTLTDGKSTFFITL